jgi:hypothetical protein
MLEKCYKSVTRVLQECHESVTRVLQECQKSVTRVLQECYKSDMIYRSNVDIANRRNWEVPKCK